MKSRLLKDRSQPRRSAARDQLAAPPKYYRTGQLKEPATSPFKPKEVKKTGTGRKLLFGLTDFVLLAVIIMGAVYSLIVKPDPQVSASSLSYRSAAVYRAAAIKQFQLLKNRNKITLDEGSIVDGLQNQFPEIASASVELPLFGERPILHLDIAPPSFFLLSGGQFYVVDQQGKVVALASSLPSVVHLTQVIDQSGFKVKVGSQTLSADNVAFINTLVAEAKHASVPIASLTLPSLAQELDLRTSDRGYYVKFFLGGDALVQSGQFLAARHDFDQSGNQPSQYLDVRVPGKIYYK